MRRKERKKPIPPPRKSLLALINFKQSLILAVSNLAKWSLPLTPLETPTLSFNGSSWSLESLEKYTNLIKDPAKQDQPFFLLAYYCWLKRQKERKSNRYMPPISMAKRDIWIGFEIPSVSISLRWSIKETRLPFISLSIFIFTELLRVFVVSFFLRFLNGIFEPKESPDSSYIESTWHRVIEVVWFLCVSDNTSTGIIIMTLFIPSMLDFPLLADELIWDDSK